MLLKNFIGRLGHKGVKYPVRLDNIFKVATMATWRMFL